MTHTDPNYPRNLPYCQQKLQNTIIYGYHKQVFVYERQI
jgi:hypothetical protein